MRLKTPRPRASNAPSRGITFPISKVVEVMKRRAFLKAATASGVAFPAIIASSALGADALGAGRMNSNDMPAGKDGIVIKNVNTIDAIDGLRSGMTVIVRGNRITRIGKSSSVQVPENATIIDGAGKYLIPGLWDAHVHLTYDSNIAPTMFPRFLANGITSVRDTGGLLKLLLPLREKARQDVRNSPRVMIAGPLLDGVPTIYDGKGRPRIGLGASSVAEAEALVDRFIAADVDFIKAYEMLSPAAFSAVIHRADSKGLHVTGHVPLSMDVITASNAGLRSMEHLRNLESSCSSHAKQLLHERRSMLKSGARESGARLRGQIYKAQRRRALNSQDPATRDEVLRVLSANATWQIPTLILSCPSLKGAYAAWAVDMVGRMSDWGIGIMAGTDCPISKPGPGVSLHEELKLLVKCGLTPMQVLEAATLKPAQYFKMETEIGTIRENMLADLVLLDANPLQDIGNTRKIHAVVRYGKLHDRTALDQMLKQV